MQKKFLYRKLEYNNEIYYQLYKIVEVDEELEITNNSPLDGVDYFYKVVNTSEENIRLEDFLYTIYHLDGDDYNFLANPPLITDLHQLFYEKYQDFDLIPKNTFDVDHLYEIITNDILYQDQNVNEVLNILKCNLDIMDSKRSIEQKLKLKHNIIIFGPKGFGKTKMIEDIVENATVPCVRIKLSTDPKENLNTVIKSLTSTTMGNMKRAENGIVFIEDNFDDLADELTDGDEPINPFYVLQDLMGTLNAYLGEDKRDFDLRKITYVLEKDTATINSDCLYDEEVYPLLEDRFANAVAFDRLTREQIHSIIEADPNSVLNTYQNIAEELGKEFIIEDDFLEYLIDRAYYDRGGIELINEYLELMIKIQWANEEIVLDKELVNEQVEDSNFMRGFIEDQERNIKRPNNVYSINDDPEYNDQKNIQEKSNVVKKNEFKIDLPNVRNEYRRMLNELMEYVKGQDEPLRNILFHTYINDLVQNSNLSLDQKKERINHLLIRGGAGTGKTYIASLVAKALNNKPYVIVDSKRYTEAGYVGKSIDDILLKLYYAAGCDIEKAQKGIIILDEFDKLARLSDDRGGGTRGAVQESLLKMIEGSILDLEVKEGAYSKNVDFDTRETMFIGLGAFEGLSKIRDARIKRGGKKQSIGFGSNQTENKNEEIFVDKNYTLEDMQEFGMDAQLLRRISYHCDLNVLTKDDYKNIMLNAKSSAFLIKLERLKMLGIDITYNEDFVLEFCDKVSKLGFGVSGISILTERIFANFESRVMLEDFEEVILTKESVVDPSKIVLVKKDEKVLKKEL